jgi:hypothetical protein
MFITSHCFVLRWRRDVSVEISKWQDAFVTSLIALYSQKFPNLEFEGEAPPHWICSTCRKGFYKRQPTKFVAGQLWRSCPVWMQPISAERGLRSSENPRVLFVELFSDAGSPSCRLLGVTFWIWADVCCFPLLNYCIKVSNRSLGSCII